MPFSAGMVTDGNNNTIGSRNIQNDQNGSLHHTFSSKKNKRSKMVSNMRFAVSDSQAALKAILTPRTSIAFVEECKNAPEELASTKYG